MLEKTTGTIMYLRKVMYQLPMKAICPVYEEKYDPKIMPRIRDMKVMMLSLFFILDL